MTRVYTVCHLSCNVKIYQQVVKRKLFILEQVRVWYKIKGKGNNDKKKKKKKKKKTVSEMKDLDKQCILMEIGSNSDEKWKLYQCV